MFHMSRSCMGNVERDILDVIKRYALKPDSIYIEMTESGFMDMTPVFCKFRKALDENHIMLCD